MDYLLPKESLPLFLDSLKKRFELIAPLRGRDGATRFVEFSAGAENLFLEGQAMFPAKDFLLPPKEELFFFRKGRIIDALDSRKRVIFGLRSCDLHAIAVLDRLFLHHYCPDSNYAARRKNTLLIGLSCSEAGENCFCSSMGTALPLGYDLLFTEQKQNYYVEVGSVRGEKVINVHKLFRKADCKKPVPKLKCTKKLDTSGIEALLERNFSSRVWEGEASRCLSCTACTEICPTCYCFMVKDSFDFGSENSRRTRKHDSCQLKRFTLVAGGHAFRESRASRLRQFVHHNLLYYKKNHGIFKCVGCGRCISHCPVGIDITRICAAMRGEGK